MLSTLSWERERIDLMIDFGCIACALLVDVAWMQELNRTLQVYIAANAEKIRELGFKIPHSNSEWRRAEFEVQCYGQVAQRARLLQLAIGTCYSPRIRWSFIEGCAVKAQDMNL